MSETMWVGLFAVFGTAIGASIAPVISVVKERGTSKDKKVAERIRACAEFAVAIKSFARLTPDSFGTADVRRAAIDAEDARWEVARHLPKKSGDVDRLCERAIAGVSAYSPQDARLEVAELYASSLMAWARGDRSARKAFADTQWTLHVTSTEDGERIFDWV